MPAFSASNLTIATAIQIGGIYVWDEDSSGGEYSLVGKSHEERKIIVGADDFAKLVNVLLVPAPVTLAGQLYPQPYAHPRAPWMRILRIGIPELIPTQQGLIEEFYTATDGSQQSLVFGNFYRCTLYYGPLDYQAFDTGDMEYSFGVQQISAATINLYDGSGNPIDGQDAIIEFGVAQIYFTRKQQLSIPWATIKAAMGAPVNSVAFPLQNGGQNSGQTLDIGTVKYNGPETTYANQGGGSAQWTVRHNFQWYEPGWNTVLKQNPGLLTTMADCFTPCYSDPGHTHPYPYATSNINVLIQ